MNIWANAVITKKGLALQAKLIEGKMLTITRAVTGAGRADASKLADETAVTSIKQTMNIRPVSYPESGKCSLSVYLTNEMLSTPYTVTQIGIYAEDPDEGEILYFICQATAGTGTSVPSIFENPFNAEWNFTFQYGQADGVTVTVDPANTISAEQALQLIAETAITKTAKNIEAGSNMDDCTEIGIYTYSMGASSSITNAPEFTQATVLVLPRLMNNNTTNLVQIAFTSTNNIYVRNRADSVWNGWRKFYKDDSVIPIENGGTGSKTKAEALSTLGAAPASHGRHVPSTCVTITDWNDAVENGWYMGNNAANGPHVSVAGGTAWYFGYVIAHNTNYVFQEAYLFTANSDAKQIPKYIRARMNGTWGAWTEVTAQRTLPENAILDGAKANLSNVVPTTIPAGADLNDYTTLGMYTYSSSSAGSIENAPDPAQSTLLVLPRLTADAHGNRIQVLISMTEKVYVRNLQDGVWREWRTVYTTGNKPTAADIGSGELAGRVMANAAASANLANSQVRNINAGTEDLTAGSSSLGTGCLYFVYE